MILTAFEHLLDFTGQPAFLDELTLARVEFIDRTGDLFESDHSFERRMTLFLEWFILDRIDTDGQRPIERYLETPDYHALNTVLQDEIECLTQSRLTLLEFRSWKGGTGRFIDLLPKTKLRVNCPVAPLGLENGDIVEGRLYELDGELFLSDAMTFLPREAKRLVAKACKSQNHLSERTELTDFVHQISYLTNRGERYSHVAPREIFKALIA